MGARPSAGQREGTCELGPVPDRGPTTLLLGPTVAHNTRVPCVNYRSRYALRQSVVTYATLLRHSSDQGPTEHSLWDTRSGEGGKNKDREQDKRKRSHSALSALRESARRDRGPIPKLFAKRFREHMRGFAFRCKMCRYDGSSATGRTERGDMRARPRPRSGPHYIAARTDSRA